MSLIHAAGGSGNSISMIIGGIAPNWGPFAGLGDQAKAMVEVIMAMAILVCFGLCAWGAARQRIGQTGGMSSMTNAEQGKGMIISGLVGVFIIGSLGTVFTIVYGMAI